MDFSPTFTGVQDDFGDERPDRGGGGVQFVVAVGRRSVFQLKWKPA